MKAIWLWMSGGKIKLFYWCHLSSSWSASPLNTVKAFSGQLFHDDSAGAADIKKECQGLLIHLYSEL